MLSSFFWGYIAPQVVAGQLAKHFGAKWFLVFTTFLGSFAAILIPYFASVFGYEGIIFCRVVQGLAQSFLFPCAHTLLSKWTPIADRAKVGGFTYAGIGTLINKYYLIDLENTPVTFSLISWGIWDMSFFSRYTVVTNIWPSNDIATVSSSFTNAFIFD